MTRHQLARIAPGRIEVASRCHAAGGIIAHTGRLLGELGHALDTGEPRAIRTATRRLGTQRPLFELACGAIDAAIQAGGEHR